MFNLCIIEIENEKPQSGCRPNRITIRPYKAEWLFFIAYVANTR